MTDAILATRNLTRCFGALAAVDDVSLDFVAGQTHAIIGPNGAGKTTLINLLSGDLKPTSGSIRLKGRDATGVPADRIARRGVGRTYQKTNLFLPLTCAESCRLAAQAHLGGGMGFFRSRRRERALLERTARALALVGLADRSDAVVGELSHGEQRQLEIAMILATGPQVLLLDEPLAGMGQEESERIIALLASLTPTHTLILVEHDMDAVFAVADVLTVMVQGRVLETGSPADVRESVAVQDAYLGSGAPAS